MTITTYTATIHDEDRGFDLMDDTTGNVLPEEGVNVTIYDENGTCMDVASYHTRTTGAWEPELITAALAYWGYAPAQPLAEDTSLESIPLMKVTRSEIDPCLPHAVAWGS